MVDHDIIEVTGVSQVGYHLGILESKQISHSRFYHLPPSQFHQFPNVCKESQRRQ